MKHSGQNYDSIRPPAIVPGVLREHSDIVAFYVSRFESPREALAVMKADRAHVEPRNTAGLSDEDAHVAATEAAQLDVAAVLWRNRVVDGVIAQLGSGGTKADVRHVRKNLQSELERFRDTRGCSPRQVELARRKVVDEQREVKDSGGVRVSGTLVDLGPNTEPFVHAWVHAWIWIEQIVYPLLVAAQAPEFFFSTYAQSRFRNFDAGDPYMTVRAWGLVALVFNKGLRAEWDALSDMARRSIREDTPPRCASDGRPVKLREHIRRAVVFERKLKKAKLLSSKPRASAETLTIEYFAARGEEIGSHTIEQSLKIVRGLRRRKRQPIDWLDFIL